MLGDVGPWIRARDWRIGPLNEDPPAREIGQSVNDLDNLTFIPFLLSLFFSPTHPLWAPNLAGSQPAHVPPQPGAQSAVCSVYGTTRGWD